MAAKLKPKKGIFRHVTNFVLKVYFVWLAAYSVVICQNPDESVDSLICCTVSATHYHVLEPYVYPLINHVLSYLVIEPYMKEIKPYAIRVHHVLQPVATTTVSKFSTHVIPRWNNLVVPQYHPYITYIQNTTSHLDPYLAVAGTEYEYYLAS